MHTLKGQDILGDTSSGRVLTREVIDTIQEPLIVLNADLCVVAASRSFYRKFGYKKRDTEHTYFYKLGEGQWDIPQLRSLLTKVISEGVKVEGFEVERTFTSIGRRIFLVRAHPILSSDGIHTMLVSLMDITKQREVEEQKNQLMRQKDTLLQEMRHRIANSLQLIASVILLKAETVKSEESRLHLQDAHDRIVSIATIQRNLDPTGSHDLVPVTHYLTKLCRSLAKSMIGGRKPISLVVRGGDAVAAPDETISLGLITTELVMNALKHAFPNGEGSILVTYDTNDREWMLKIADDGVGITPGSRPEKEGGLGTNIVNSIAKQIKARIHQETSSKGTTISIIGPIHTPPAHAPLR